MIARHVESVPGRGRLLAAFAAVPVVQALIAFLAFPLVWAMGGHAGQLHDPAGAAAAFAFITLVTGALVTICGVVPVVLWLIRRGSASLSNLVIAGLALGNVPFALYVVRIILPATAAHWFNGTLHEHVIPPSELLLGVLRVGAIGSTLGTLSAALFWFVAIRGTDAARSGDRMIIGG